MILAFYPVILAFYPAIPDFYPVIPAKAGIQRVAGEVDAARILACDSRGRVVPAR